MSSLPDILGCICPDSLKFLPPSQEKSERPDVCANAERYNVYAQLKSDGAQFLHLESCSL